MMFEGKCIDRTHVWSDTKVELKGADRANWSQEARIQLRKYGLAKTMVLGPSLCLSFAGNDILRVSALLDQFAGIGPFELGQFVSSALEIHLASSDVDDIEFLILMKEDEDSSAELICIKEGRIARNCHSAWIGSYEAFKTLQEQRICSEAGRVADLVHVDLFWRTIQDCHDETVGGFPIEVCLYEGRFQYATWFWSQVERVQEVPAGGKVLLEDGAEGGGFTVSLQDCEGEPLMHFSQNNVSVLYSRKYRYGNPELYHPATKHLLLPIPFESSTGGVL